MIFPSVRPPTEPEGPDLSPASPYLWPSLWCDRLPPLILLIDGAPFVAPPKVPVDPAGSRETPLGRWRFLSKFLILLERFRDPNIPPDRTKFKFNYIIGNGRH